MSNVGTSNITSNMQVRRRTGLDADALALTDKCINTINKLDLLDGIILD